MRQITLQLIPGSKSFDFETDRANEEHNPTAINSVIRQILHAFSRKAYVGYTATPFANIFIHERGRTTKEGNDLFPEALFSIWQHHPTILGRPGFSV